MDEDKKTIKMLAIFFAVIGIVVVAQLVLANYLQSIY
tara:strand:- start:1221 stop:1331 length:111 start_codon:yes stop_codon:yes gene_type:complete